MDLNKLYEILAKTTCQLRKGSAVEERDVGNIHVTEIYAMPHESEARDDLEKVDLFFVKIGVDKAEVEKHRQDLIGLLSHYPRPERLSGGPSYIEMGAEVGDQGAALCLFALGKVLGLWSIITPETFGITGPEARNLAGSGMVLISGYTP